MLFYAWALGLGTVLGLFTRGSQKVFLALAILWAGLATLAGNPLGVLLFVGETIAFTLAFFLSGTLAKALYEAVKGR